MPGTQLQRTTNLRRIHRPIQLQRYAHRSTNASGTARSSANLEVASATSTAEDSSDTPRDLQECVNLPRLFPPTRLSLFHAERRQRIGNVLIQLQLDCNRPTRTSSGAVDDPLDTRVTPRLSDSAISGTPDEPSGTTVAPPPKRRDASANRTQPLRRRPPTRCVLGV